MAILSNKSLTTPDVIRNLGERRLSIGGKTSEITKADLLDFAKQNDIKNANAMINRVADGIKDFNRYATEYGITQPWRSIIQKTLTENLNVFGYLDKEDDANSTFSDTFGRTINRKSRLVKKSAILDLFLPPPSLYRVWSRKQHGIPTMGI